MRAFQFVAPPRVVNAILLISPEGWGDHSVSKHHYAKTLAQEGFPVLFLNPPSTVKNIEISQSIRHRNLYVVNAPMVARGLRFYPAWLRRWMEYQWLKRLEILSGFTIGTVWLFENSRFFDMRFAGHRLKIYHQVDLNQNFQPTIAARTADACFCTTDNIRARLLPYSPRAYKVHHGTAVSAQPLGLTAELSAHFLHNGHNACYIGSLDMVYLDAELLATVVQTYPTVRFHFIGGFSPQGRLHQLASNLPNVVWWGSVPSALIPSILERSDIVLCTYKAAQYREQLASPHKFMEYLASGKIIVATYTDEYKEKRHLLEMVDDASDYIAVFGRVLADLPAYNSPARQSQRVAYAMDHSYPRQLEKIISILRDHGLAEPFNRNISE